MRKAGFGRRGNKRSEVVMGKKEVGDMSNRDRIARLEEREKVLTSPAIQGPDGTVALWDPEVLDRAVEEGRESVRTGMHVNTTQGYREQEFRAIAAAAYRQGREGLEARIEAKAGELDAMAQAQADEFGNYITSAGRSGEYKEGRADAYDDAAESLRSLLTDKEEGNDRV